MTFPLSACVPLSRSGSPLHLIALLVLLFTCFLGSVRADFELGAGDDRDLTSFVTRPEIKVPKFDIVVHQPDQVVPGYWFVAPYANILQDPQARRYYQACQTGPAIYDQNGELVWTGACLFRNNNVCDFRVWTDENGTSLLSGIQHMWRDQDPVGFAVVLDQHLMITKRVNSPPHMVPFNMHEFNVLDGGKSALMIIQHVELSDVLELDIPGLNAGMVLNQAIREVDLKTGEPLFTWWAHEHIPYSASYFDRRRLKAQYPDGWDWIHLNAVEKTPSGDYIVTARYTDAIYKISGQDGRLLWTLGGKYSNFTLQGFNFSRPHDARWVAEDERYDTISFLDNAGDEYHKIADVSTAYIIKLDKKPVPGVATVLQAWPRPDGGRSEKRGNFQLLPNGNAFVGWSENSYMTEHSPTGDLIMEAQFASTRFVSYRSYKFNFTSQPFEAPVLKAFVYGAAPPPAAQTVSAYYVSWNGATEVAEWRFYDADESLLDGEERLLGVVPRRGFETVLHSERFVLSVFAEARGRDGVVLGVTESVDVVLPEHWYRAGGEGVGGGAAGETEVVVGDEDGQSDGDGWEKEEL